MYTTCQHAVYTIVWLTFYRLQLEVDDVLGTKKYVSAEDLDKLQYTEQVATSLVNIILSCITATHPLPDVGLVISLMLVLKQMFP